MNLAEFELIKTLCQNSEQIKDRELDIDELPNVRDRLKDGANILDLYMELTGYFYTMGMNDEGIIDYEDSFWGEAEEILVDLESTEAMLIRLQTINVAADAIVKALETLSVPGAEQESEKGIRAMIDAAVDKRIRNLAK